MIFSVQHFLEDYFERRGLSDADQYAVRVANLYERVGADADPEAFAQQLGRVRTVFYRRNGELDRRSFESQLVAQLKRRFKKKTDSVFAAKFSFDVQSAQVRLRNKRRNIKALVFEFKRAVEARGVDAFWSSRKANRLHSRPESIAQAILAVFAKGILGPRGLVIREFVSGIGFVDVGIAFGGVLHLIELKILATGQFVGASQLATYMKTEGRKKGWLMILDARANQSEQSLPERIETSAGTIEVAIVNINPVPPSAT